MKLTIKSANQKQTITCQQPITGTEIVAQYFFAEKNQIVAFLVNEQLASLDQLVTTDATIKLLTPANQASFLSLNYTCGLLLAKAITEIFTDVEIVVCETSDEGFYLDLSLSKPLKKEDLATITMKMKTLAAQPINFHDCFITSNHPESLLQRQKFAATFYQQLTDKPKSLYQISNDQYLIALNEAFVNSKIITSFVLQSVTGAYFLGNETNEQLQRISGICHWNENLLQEKIAVIAERKLRDHRVIGKKLNIFTFSDGIGKGLPIWLANGMALKKTLQDFLRKKEAKWGYEEVSTPVLGNLSLYKTSGHWDHYQANMFQPMVHENETLVLRPMTCPHHCMIFQSQLRSYRELPIRYSEHSLLYRYETSGALTGLERVRAMELTDAHIFVRDDQIKSEFKRCFYLISEVLQTLNISISYYSLSLPDFNDQDKYYNDRKMWDHACGELKSVLDEMQINYQTMVGEAAFYGPKFDIQIKTPIGHDITISTIQFDFLTAKKFNLTYVNDQNQAQNPIIIHRGLIGTYERFIATLLEQTQGIFPLWLAPIQVVILPINDLDETLAYCHEFLAALIDQEIRAKVIVGESLNKRIKAVHEQKVPYVVIIGKKEIHDKTITYHTYQAQKANHTSNLSNFVKMVVSAIKNK